MKFRYEIDPNNEGVTLIGIEDLCPDELKVPTFIEIDYKEIKVIGVNFSSVYSDDNYQCENGITCRILYIPDTVQNIFIESNKFIHEVFLPNSLTKIEDFTFCNCENLKIVNLPPKLETIGINAFYGCKSIEEISLPTTLVKMEYGCFEGCSSLISIIIPENVKEIEPNSFAECSNLCEVTFKNDSTIFYPTTFKGCKSLKKLSDHIIENGLLYNLEMTELYTYLGNNSHIIVPESVCEIGNGFSYSADLTSIDLSKTQISIIHSDTFNDCVNLQKVILPPNIKSIEDRSFCKCINLSEINFPDSIENIGVACFYGCAIKEIVLPNNLREISKTTFSNCKKLSKVSIPLAVKTIHNSAFNGCDMIERVTISEGFRHALSKIFKNSNTINFIFRTKAQRFNNLIGFKRTGAYTHGSLRPCPYCGSNDVEIYCDGTAECNTCEGEYIYQY